MNRTMSAWLLCAALLTGSAASAKRDPEPIELSDEDDGRVYRVPVGTEFEVRLPGQVGDYSQWEMRDDPRFIPVDPPWREGYGHNRGDRENRIFTVRVTQRGRFPLVFEKLSTFGGSKRSQSGRVTYLIDAGLIEGRGERPDALSDSGPPAPPLREPDAGREIHVRDGREITILLPFASRLDQRWQVIGSHNIGLTRAVAEQADPTRKRNIFWLDSNSVIRLRPSGPGKAEVTLGYLPAPRDGGSVRQLRYRFVVD